ncbi:hypothetical protein SAMD00019534_105400 [Acytostelium subglobosum LB1]|uniref:hypothetical protein n=1 Tax=Acytostelium subglobosum LB1 TaxID=1410327 RepID=UPI000644A74A|nr:hypothetical protein SAMD00019534_105400 [Acytostelium subglobosum LB1]GAM27365.1 hypothetical protein SAMD00019534_105400 [Acytostelium subglobosum LB1]|eukprot:XP_012749832.1 hypothetical protein SAMD00019534_105400 [Acytostelium subglobosum LB1]
MSELDWINLPAAEKERIALYWVDHYIHPTNGIIFSMHGNANYLHQFRLVPFNIFKPRFHAPKVVSLPDGSITVDYWHYDQQSGLVRHHLVRFNEKGNIVARSIIPHQSQALAYSLSTAVVLTLALLSNRVIRKSLFQSIHKVALLRGLLKH